MKKAGAAVIIVLLAGYLFIKAFNYKNRTGILSNQAVFDISLDLREDQIDRYFGLPQGTFDPDKLIIICKLPVDPETLKPVNLPVNIGTGNMNCDDRYDSRKHIKYDNTELKGNEFELEIVSKYGRPIGLGNMEDRALSSRKIQFDYTKGKINHIVISLLEGAREYCQQDQNTASAGTAAKARGKLELFAMNSK